MAPELILPDWPAPPNVLAFSTTRRGGVSRDRHASLNLGDHVGDDPQAVARNRDLLSALLPASPLWLQQVHGVDVAEAERSVAGVTADAAWAHSVGHVCVVMTADCLPILLCDRNGSAVATVHAGWRSLCAGIVERVVRAMRIPAGDLLAWLGPAIGPQAFEVGGEVRAAFVAHSGEAAKAFVAHEQGKFLADIYCLARQRLAEVGVLAIYGGNLCTVADSERFFSFRRDGVTGRMGSFICLRPQDV